MSKKRDKSGKVVNAPKVIWCTNLPGASVGVSRNYLSLYLRPKQRPMMFKIDGPRLWEQLRKVKEGQVLPVGNLDLVIRQGELEMYVMIQQPEEDKPEFDFEVEVALTDLINAVALTRLQ